MTGRFSQRYGYGSADPEITVRDDAPGELRSVLIDIAYESGLRPNDLREVVCRVLRVASDPGNWSDYPNIDNEVRWQLMNCDWFGVYDVIEEISNAISDGDPANFEDEINSYFQRKGIGWQLVDGRIEVRGPESFEVIVTGALDTLEEEERATAHTELREALGDLSRRPEADITGAIQHAMAALECVARDITGDPKPTLGKILKDNPNLLPRPLDQVVSKAWGYASDRARHLREGNSPPFEDAELIVGMSAALCSYLMKKST